MLISFFPLTKMPKQILKNGSQTKLSHLLFILLIFSINTSNLVECDSPDTPVNSQKPSNFNTTSSNSNINSQTIVENNSYNNNNNNSSTGNETTTFVDELSKLETVLFDYVNEVLTKNFFDVLSRLTAGVFNGTETSDNDTETDGGEELRRAFNTRVSRFQKLFAKTKLGSFVSPRAVQTGRLFFFKGLKKLLWPLIFGVQIIKLILLMLFLPGIIGSVGKILGKGLPSFSGFSQPAEPVEDLDFKDNSYGHDQDAYQNDYHSYPPTDSDSANSFVSQMYDTAASGATNVLTRYGLTPQKSNMNISPYSAHMPQQPQKTKMASKKDDFKTFHDIPSSSLMLSHYDPFYSPLLSRLDAVFQQMNLDDKNEKCREKLICLMYANPAKYAPYSNLVSAQLSRELNELRKPSSDNPDILRFFKYMRAAKDGQDRLDCEQIYECASLKESENPAMLSTFNDINKLVAARKLN